MKCFRNVSFEKQIELQNQFSAIDELFDDYNKFGYKNASISVYDHWLTREEAEEQLDKISDALQIKHNIKLHSFCCNLTNEVTSYLVKFKGRYKNKVVFKEFLSSSGREKSIIPLEYNYGDKWRFVIVFPSLNLVYFEGCDFTHHFYYRDKSGFKVIENIAKQSGVHVL